MFTRFLLAAFLHLALLALPLAAQTTWLISNTTNIGGNVVTKLGNPQVISTPYGDAVQFNGINDGLIVSNNPLAGMTNLTAELIFQHYPLTVASAWQPRIVHIEAPGATYRLTLETRVSTNTTPQMFLLDTFLRFGSTSGYSLTLSNAGFSHPVGDWSHMAITYDGTNFKNYVNGRLEKSGPMSGLVFAAGGTTTIGQRNNNTNYFEGAALALRFTPRVLSTNEFMCIPKTLLRTPQLSNGQAQLDFALTAGLPIGFTLLQADTAGEIWTVNSSAVLATNSEGVSYRFTTPVGNSNRFFRVRWP